MDLDYPAVYLDYAASAPLLPAAARAVRAGEHLLGNPSSSHQAGRVAADALAGARRSIARLLGVTAPEVVLTSGGSEADALALWGTFAARRFRGHLVTTAIEHAAVLETARALAEFGVEVTVLDPRPSGHIDADAVAAALRPDTALVAVMHANNETGAIQPVEDIAALTRRAGVAFHTDAVHTAGKIDLGTIGATMISVSAHKFGGPRGIGALAVRAGHRLSPMVRGGAQELGRRAGTENVPGALGMAAAAEACLGRLTPAHRRRMTDLRRRLLAGLRAVGGAELNATEPVLAETVSVRFAGVRGDTLADALDLQGIAVSTGSACHTGSESASHVLVAQGLSEQQARSSIRISWGADVSGTDIDAVSATVARSVAMLRRAAGAVGVSR